VYVEINYTRSLDNLILKEVKKKKSSTWKSTCFQSLSKHILSK